MARVRPGSRCALMVVDLQVGVVAHAPGGAAGASDVLQRVQATVARARAAGVPVIWVQHHDDDGLAQGSESWAWAPPLQPTPGEVQIFKAYNSAFEDTPLDAELARLQISHVVLAGAATNWCIRATAYGALDRGYDLTLLGDAHLTGDLEGAQGLIPAAQIVAELNEVLRWVRYPGRTSSVVPAAAFDFAKAAT